MNWKNTGKKTTSLGRRGFGMISDSDKMGFWFILLFVIALCFIFVLAWTNLLKGIYMNDALEPTAFEARLVYSNECFAYEDSSTGRVMPGIIDSHKFNQQRLNRCLPLDIAAEHGISARLEAKNMQTLLVESPNWNMKTDSVSISKYVVEIDGYGPGMLTFMHKTGK